jgi:hypothetical protein
METGSAPGGRPAFRVFRWGTSQCSRVGRAADLGRHQLRRRCSKTSNRSPDAERQLIRDEQHQTPMNLRPGIQKYLRLQERVAQPSFAPLTVQGGGEG